MPKDKKPLTQTDRFIQLFSDVDTFPCSEEPMLEVSEKTLFDLGEDISLIEELLQASILRDDKDEIASLRRNLQEAKIAYREIRDKLKSMHKEDKVVA